MKKSAYIIAGIILVFFTGGIIWGGLLDFFEEKIETITITKEVRAIGEVVIDEKSESFFGTITRLPETIPSNTSDYSISARVAEGGTIIVHPKSWDQVYILREQLKHLDSIKVALKSGVVGQLQDKRVAYFIWQIEPNQ